VLTGVALRGGGRPAWPWVSRPAQRPVAIDEAWDAVLSEFDPALREPIRRYDAKRAEYEAKSALSTAMIRTGTRWREADAVTGKIIYAGIA
jgi:hypothetical protein